MDHFSQIGLCSSTSEMIADFLFLEIRISMPIVTLGAPSIALRFRDTVPPQHNPLSFKRKRLSLDTTVLALEVQEKVFVRRHRLAGILGQMPLWELGGVNAA